MLTSSAFGGISALSRFTPVACLGGIPEDILLEILQLVDVLDILALRLTCRRLCATTKQRLVWLRALQDHYRQRCLPPPTALTTLSMTTEEIECEALRPARFLHGLADAESAQYCLNTYGVEDKAAQEEVFTPTEEDDPRIGVVAFRVMPGGRFAVLAVNARAPLVHASARGVLLIWDLLRQELKWKYTTEKPMHYASIQPDEDGKGMDIIVGLDKTRQEEPLFLAVQVPYPVGDLENAKLKATRSGAIRIVRSARACSVLGSLVAFTDRNGNMSFWNWKEKTSGAMHVSNWPTSKGKIMLLSQHQIAVFNTTMSSFSIHNVPPLSCISIMSTAADVHSQPIMKSRLPAKNLMITIPQTIPASSFKSSNLEFRDPFSAFFLGVHPGVSSHVHIGIIPVIKEPSHQPHLNSQGSALDQQSQEGDDMSGEDTPPEPQGSAPPSGPEHSWLQFMRCVDQISPSSFSQVGRVLWTGSIDSSVGILRITDENLLEIFTTSALHQPNRSRDAVARGDYQVLSYRPTGRVWAASVDDLSGKVCLLVQDVEKAYRLVVVDYGAPAPRERSGTETESENQEEDEDEDEEELDDADTCRSPF